MPENKCLFCGRMYIIDKHNICRKCVFGQALPPKKNTSDFPELALDCLNTSDSHSSQESPTYESNISMKPLPTIHLKEKLNELTIANINAIRRKTLDKPELLSKSLNSQITDSLDKITMPNAPRRNTLEKPELLLKSLNSQPLTPIYTPNSIRRKTLEKPDLLLKALNSELEATKPKLSDALDRLTMPKALRRKTVGDPNSLTNALRTIRSEQNLLSQPVERPKNKEHDSLLKTLRYTNSEPNILTKTPPPQIGEIIRPPRRKTLAHSDLLYRSLMSEISKDATPVAPQTEHEKKRKLKNLQSKIMDAKQKAYAARQKLGQYSISDSSPSFVAARLEHSLAEREIEEACKAWCHANRDS